MSDHHEWFQAQFTYASWLECACGYRPQTQAEMDSHIRPDLAAVSP